MSMSVEVRSLFMDYVALLRSEMERPTFPNPSPLVFCLDRSNIASTAALLTIADVMARHTWEPPD